MIRRRMQVDRIHDCTVTVWERGCFFSGELSAGGTLLCVRRGAVHCVVQGQSLLLEQGDMTVCGPGQWYMAYGDMDEEPEVLRITFSMEGDWPARLFGIRFPAWGQGEELLQRICREMVSPDSCSDDMILSLMTQLMLSLLRLDRPGAVSVGENAIILKAQQYISDHRREQLTVPIAARCTDVSASYLTALFRKNLGISPGEYIRRVKLEESRQMIREGKLNFTEIAAALEYSTVHHFSRQFKEKFGMTPTEYAKSVG